MQGLKQIKHWSRPRLVRAQNVYELKRGEEIDGLPEVEERMAKDGSGTTTYRVDIAKRLADTESHDILKELIAHSAYRSGVISHEESINPRFIDHISNMLENNDVLELSHNGSTNIAISHFRRGVLKLEMRWKDADHRVGSNALLYMLKRDIDKGESGYFSTK